METYQDNKRYLWLTYQDNLRVALAEIIHPRSNKNVTTSEYMIHTPKTPYDMVPKFTKHSDATIIKREDWSNNALFPEGEYISVEKILKQSKKEHETRKPLEDATVLDDIYVELNVAESMESVFVTEVFWTC